MAQCVQSVQEFIQDSFVPLVAALCSEEAERLTRRNNLSFAELVRPFCRLTSEGRCRQRSALLFTRGGGGGAAAPSARGLGGPAGLCLPGSACRGNGLCPPGSASLSAGSVCRGNGLCLPRGRARHPFPRGGPPAQGGVTCRLGGDSRLPGLSQVTAVKSA